MAETIELGIVGISNKGEYDAQTSYEKLNVVTYEGSSYCAKRNCKGILPTNTEYWQLYAEKGEKGETGATGATGAKGSRGDQGLPGEPGGSPLVANSTTAMVDETKVYVNTSDGKWYYHNGSSWVAGGVYQSTGIDSNSIKLNNISNDILNFYKFDYDFVIGDVNGGNGTFNTTSTNRCRFIKKIWLEAGTLVRFNQGDTGYQYGYFMWDQLANTPIDAHLGWPTYSEIVLTESRYYCFRMRKSDNTDITAEEFEDMTSRLTFFRPVLNTAGQLIDFYSIANPFVIQERYTPAGGVNHNIRFTTVDTGYWLTFENLVQFHNHNWTSTDKRISRRLKYDIPSEYGTVDTTGDNDMLDIVIPNNYSLVLNTVTGVISLKTTATTELNDAILIRCSQGRCIAGAFRQIVDYWRLRTIDTDLSNLSTRVDTMETDISGEMFKNKTIDFYGVNKTNNNERYNIEQIIDIDRFYPNGTLQSFVTDFARNRIIALNGSTTARLFNYNGESLGTLTKPSTGHDNDTCYVNGVAYVVGASYNNSKDVYKWDISTNTVELLDMSAITDQPDRNRNVIGGICQVSPNSNKLYIISANSNNTINHNANDKINIYEYDTSTESITFKAEFPNDIIYVQGATCLNGLIYIVTNTLKANSTYHDGTTIKVINTNTWQLVKEIIIDVEDTEPECINYIIESGVPKLVFGIAGWSAIKSSIYTIEVPK